MTEQFNLNLDGKYLGDVEQEEKLAGLYIGYFLEQDFNPNEKEFICGFFDKYPNLIKEFNFKNDITAKADLMGVNAEQYFAHVFILEIHSKLVRFMCHMLKDEGILSEKECEILEMSEIKKEENEDEKCSVRDILIEEYKKLNEENDRLYEENEEYDEICDLVENHELYDPSLTIIDNIKRMIEYDKDKDKDEDDDKDEEDKDEVEMLCGYIDEIVLPIVNREIDGETPGTFFNEEVMDKLEAYDVGSYEHIYTVFCYIDTLFGCNAKGFERVAKIVDGLRYACMLKSLKIALLEKIKIYISLDTYDEDLSFIDNLKELFDEMKKIDDIIRNHELYDPSLSMEDNCNIINEWNKNKVQDSRKKYFIKHHELQDTLEKIIESGERAEIIIKDNEDCEMEEEDQDSRKKYYYIKHHDLHDTLEKIESIIKDDDKDVEDGEEVVRLDDGNSEESDESDCSVDDSDDSCDSDDDSDDMSYKEWVLSGILRELQRISGQLEVTNKKLTKDE